jgi:uncharacterized protein (TIGR03083 family)
VQHTDILTALSDHCDGIRQAVVAAGPDKALSTCPGWTVHRLVRHLARVQSWARASLADPSGENVAAGDPPQDWDTLLGWWDEQRHALVDELGGDPETPAWLPFGMYPQTVGSVARRQAHEAGIHRIDAAIVGLTGMVTFRPEFSADGIDEFLALLLPSRPAEHQVEGSVLVHAKDVDRLWSLRLEPGTPLRSADPEQPFEPDLSITGVAEQVYRALWGRPYRAGVAGDRALLEPLRAP